MQLIYSKCRSRNSALSQPNSLQACRAFSQAALLMLVLLCGCAAVVSPGSGSPKTFGISGTISPQAAGNGATLALNGPTSASATGNSSGNYSSSGLVNGTYAVTPSRSGYTFSPSVQKVSVSGSDVSGINFTASSQIHSVKLSWRASSSTVAGYNIYRSRTNGGPYFRINGAPVGSLTYTDSLVSGATTYYYVTTSVDSAGMESAYSNQASAKIP